MSRLEEIVLRYLLPALWLGGGAAAAKVSYGLLVLGSALSTAVGCAFAIISMWLFCWSVISLSVSFSSSVWRVERQRTYGGLKDTNGW